jgi:hypothetical protein
MSNPSKGSTIVEFVIVLPILLLLILGVIEIGYALYENHLIVKLAREGANLISRQSTLQEAETAIVGAAMPPVAFNADGKLILSVIKLGTGGANLNTPIVYQRRVVGSLDANSVLGNPLTTSFSGAPDYTAVDPDNDAGIRIPGTLPNGLTLTPGQSVFVTEVFTRHTVVTPLASFGLQLPANLYASAYF